jgi:FtsP/CotA-like multicopper oxidase with cupredoxin domain
MILINGQFPGPMIEANWGDMISVTVTNNIETDTAEGMTLHWHGLTQVQTPWMDGVPGVSQCPIVPGSSFTYTFQADQFGTGWYHSHYSAQYNDGLFGPMIIHGPLQDGVNYDYDLGPIMVSDYSHMSYYEALELLYKIPPEFANVDNNLINGKGAYDCSDLCEPGTGLAKFNFTSGKLHRLRIINTGMNANQKFSIDGHKMTVIANDYVPIKPYTTTVVTLGVGQRTDVIVNATGKPTSLYWMRSDVDMDCLNNTATIPNGTAIIYYEHADTSALPTTTPTPWTNNQCRNDPLVTTIPYYPQTPPAIPGTTKDVLINLAANSTGFIEMFVNNISFRINYDNPLLLLAKAGNTSYPEDPQWNVYNFGSNSSVRLVFTNIFGMQHPMHLHGHNFWVLAEGSGTWNGTITNPTNPQRRDTHLMAPGTIDNPSYLVLEWEQNNPGVWPLHCHMSTHVSGGLLLNVMVSNASISGCRG